MLLESGLALQDVADHLGHSSFEITSKYYLRLIEKRKHESVEKMMHYLENYTKCSGNQKNPTNI